MKKLIKLASAVSLGLTLIIAGCKGDVGPVGPAGANGTNGAIGQPGTNGTNGTNGATGATGQTGRSGVGNVKSLNITVKTNNLVDDGIIGNTDYQQLSYANLNSSTLSNSLVIKSSYISSTSYLDSVFNNGSIIVYKIITSGAKVALPFTEYKTGNLSINESYLYAIESSSYNLYFIYKNSSFGSISYASNNNYKVVLISGVANARKEAPEVDFNNYEAVKAYYNLAD